MILSIIAGIGKNRELGLNNKLLWHISADLKNFKKVTSGKPIIMGRKTYDSIGRPLPKRRNIVISRNQDLRIEGVEVFTNPDDAISALKSDGVQEAVVIGGSFIYEHFLSSANRIYISDVNFEGDADVFFPDFNRREFSLDEEIAHPAIDDTPEWTFRIYNRL